MITNEQLKEYVTNNPKLVSVKSAGNDLFVLKYRKKVFYDDLWNEYLEHCRGTIVDKDFNVVQYPFTKIYNYGVEASAPSFDPDETVTAMRKVNGFMVALTWYNDEILVSTTGSTDSDFVGYAKEMMAKHAPMVRWNKTLREYNNYTFLFECVHPEDPHIIHEEPGMYLLAVREKKLGSEIRYKKRTLDHFSSELDCFSPARCEITVSELLLMTKGVRHEGYVFYHEDGRAAKIKSPFYLMRKWLARKNDIDRMLMSAKGVKWAIAEEYYPIVDSIRANKDQYAEMTEQERLAWISVQFEQLY